MTLTQVFTNYSTDKTPRAKYVFPIPAGAAVCAFQMRTEDGRVIHGVVKDHQEAQREHEQALSSGKLTSLVEWATNDSKILFSVQSQFLISSLQSSQYPLDQFLESKVLPPALLYDRLLNYCGRRVAYVDNSLS